MISKKQVLLINPPLYFSDGIPRSLDVSAPPLGLLYLASYINHYSDELEASIMDVGAEGFNIDDVKEKISSMDPFVIGISSMTPQLQGAMELARAIKFDLNCSAKVFFGGPHISADSGFAQRHADVFDYAITGEAEKTFLDSLHKLVSGEEIPTLQTSEVVMELDKIPVPDKTLIKRKLYLKSESMLFGRGCPFHCYYCSRPSISRKVRYRSVENLLGEIKACYEFCEGHLHFQDDTFTMRRDIVVEFCNEVKKSGLRLYWDCNTRIDLVDDDLLKLMHEAGCVQINFGVESGNEKVRRDVINKGKFTNDCIKEVFESCRRHDINIACYFMIGHPTETKEELQETQDMILNSDIDVLGLSIPIPFPGSTLYDIAKKEGIIDEDIIDQFADKKLGEGYAGIYPVYVAEGMPYEYVSQVMRDINRKFYVNFKTFWSRLKQDISSFERLKTDALDLISLILRGMSVRKPYVKKRQ